MLPSPLGRWQGSRRPFSLADGVAGDHGGGIGGGLVASIVVGVLIALLFAQSRWVRRMLYPYTILLQTVPIVAIAPLILDVGGTRARCRSR